MKCPKCGNKEGNFIFFINNTPDVVWQVFKMQIFKKANKWYDKDKCAYCQHRWNRYEEKN